jgi:hypothetical protein
VGRNGRFWNTPLGTTPVDASRLGLVDGGIGQLSDIPGAWIVEAALTPPRLEGVALDDFLARLAAHPRLFPLDEQRRDIILANFVIRPDRTIAPHLTFGRHMRLVRAMWESPVYRNFEAVRCPVLMVGANGGEGRSVQSETYRELKQRGAAHAARTIRDLRVEWLEDTTTTSRFIGRRSSPGCRPSSPGERRRRHELPKPQV